jgi:hypothetical protein
MQSGAKRLMKNIQAITVELGLSVGSIHRLLHKDLNLFFFFFFLCQHFVKNANY